MENLELVLSFAGTILGLAITVLTFIVKTMKNSKARGLAEKAIEISNAVLPLIREAEKFTAYSGAEKKSYVMTRVNQFALKNNINFDEAQVSKKIEELVAFSKQVNVDKHGFEAISSEKQENKSWL